MANPPTAAAVAEWFEDADGRKLNALVAAKVDGKKLLLAARRAMDETKDREIKELALEVDDILRRYGGEEAASGVL